MVAHDLATRLSAQLGLREGAARPDSERPVRFDHLSPGGRQLHEADRVRVDREQLLAHRARLKAAHDGSDTMVPAGSTDRVDLSRRFRKRKDNPPVQCKIHR